jgi:D-sedoheptulose 7-phosphate isomerase
MQQQIQDYFKGHLSTLTQMSETMLEPLAEAALVIAATLERGNKLLIAGNGGSAADAQHFAAEMVGRFLRERRALPAIALTTDSSILTAVGNDYGFDQVFSRQVDALAVAGDLFIGISTSGNSANVCCAAETAAVRDCGVLALVGGQGGRLARLAKNLLVIPSDFTPHVQEGHLLVIHLLCLLVETRLAGLENN